jgi:hypothetical protein
MVDYAQNRKRAIIGAVQHHCRENLGVGMATIQCMLCACDECIKLLDLKNVCDRHVSSIACKYWDIFEGLDDWKIIKLVPCPESSEDDVDEAKQMVLHGIATEAAEEI